MGRFRVVGVDGNGGLYRDVDLPGMMLQPGEHYLICPANGQVPNCDLAIKPTEELGAKAAQVKIPLDKAELNGRAVQLMVTLADVKKFYVR